jgi:hypothetical protein
VATKKVNRKRLTKLPLAKQEVAVMAVFLLGGDKKFVDLEDVAVQASKIAPKAFAWRKYPDQINLDLVRVVLSNAKHSERGALLHGSGVKGWRLSDAGVIWARGKGQALLGKRQPEAAPWAGSSDARRSDRELQRVKASAAWAQWLTEGTVDSDAARLLFRIDDYATPEMRDQKVARLRSAIMADEEAARFLEAAVAALSSQVGDAT